MSTAFVTDNLELAVYLCLLGEHPQVRPDSFAFSPTARPKAKAFTGFVAVEGLPDETGVNQRFSTVVNGATVYYRKGQIDSQTKALQRLQCRLNERLAHQPSGNNGTQYYLAGTPISA